MTRYAPLWLQDETYPASVDRRLMGALWPSGGANGCMVSSAGAGMMLEIAPGSVAVPSANNTGTALCVSDAVENLALDPAVHPPNQERCDLIICQARGADLDGGTDNDFIFAFVTGVPYAPPFDPVRDTPATPPGALALARAIVVGGSVTIDAAHLTDMRPGGLGAGGPRDLLHARWVRTASLPVPSAVIYDQASFDPGRLWVPWPASYFSIPTPGVYQISAQHHVDFSSPSWAQLQLVVNGVSEFTTSADVVSIGVNLTLVQTRKCTTGDQIQINVGAGMGGTLSGGAQSNACSIDYLGSG
jgi:hypothetical protein